MSQDDTGITYGVATPVNGDGGIAAALEAGQLLARPQELTPGVFSVTVPSGARHELVRNPPAHPDFDHQPERARGTYHPATVDAFVDIVKRHADDDQSTVWVHPTSGRIVAVLNDAHPDAGPAWRDHRAELNLQVTPEWNLWKSQDGRLLGQQAFAEHIEDGVTEIVRPSAAEMLELAQTFHAHTTAQFRSAHRLQSGEVQLRYDEEMEAKAGRSGELSIPTDFELAISPFLGEAPYKVTALLRYRVSGGNLTLGYKLQQPDRVVRDALEKIAEKLDGEFPNVFIGEPARARYISIGEPATA